MATITYSLTPVSTEFTGTDNQVFRANVQTNGTINAEEFALRLAKKTKLDPSFARYFLQAFAEELRSQILAGYRVHLGQISTGFAIKGAFKSEDDRFDPARHTLIATIRTLDPLNSALSEVQPDNIAVSLACTVNSLMDNVTKETNVITGTNEQHIQGTNLGVSADNADEGVWLEDGNGNIVATATISASDAQTITCSFPATEAGEYTLVVSCRNGNRETLAPAIGRLKVTVKAAA